MKNSQIAVQLWTLRNFLKTPADVVETFRKVRKIGYEAIELAGLPPMDEAEIVRIADGDLHLTKPSNSFSGFRSHDVSAHRHC